MNRQKSVFTRAHRFKGGRLTAVLLFLLLFGLVMGGGAETAVAANDCNSQATGNWSTAATWTGCAGGIPQDGDNVVISAGHTVTVNTITNQLNSLTVNGILRFDNSGTGKTMTVTGDVVINNGGTLDAATGGSATTHTLTIGGDFANNGTFDGLPATGRIVNVTFNKNGDQTISGAGSTKFNVLTVNMGVSRDNILDVQAVISLAASANPLVITNGTFKLSSNSTITPFTTNVGTAYPATGGFWVANGNVNRIGGSWLLDGLLRVSGGTLNIGTTGGNSLSYRNGSEILIEGGVLNIAGRLSRETGLYTTTYTQTGGLVSVVQIGSATTNQAGFDIGATGSSFTMSGGTIVIQQATSSTNGDYYNIASTHNVTGGTLQIGNANTPNASTIRINSSVPIGNLIIDGSTSQTTKPTAHLLTNNLSVRGGVTIQAGTTLNANNLNASFSGNWTNDGSFTAGTGTVTFNGNALQTISGSSATVFNNVVVNSGASVVIPANATATSLTNNGRIQQTQDVTGSGEFYFLDLGGYGGVSIENTGADDLGSTTVVIRGNQACTTTDSTVRRCFDIAPTPSGPNIEATIYFSYAESEINDLDCPSLHAWHWTNGMWELAGESVGWNCVIDPYSVTVEGVTGFSPFVLFDDQDTMPTAVSLSAFSANTSLPLLLVVVVGLLLGGTALLTHRRKA